MEYYSTSDEVQFRQANRALAVIIEKNPKLAAKFSDEQIKQINRGKTPKGYAWHHHQELGKLQLVDAKIHRLTGHTGGKAMWGGGRFGRRGNRIIMEGVAVYGDNRLGIPRPTSW
ncbi:HNH endonuclease [Cohnella sp.]|uniref:HNH endonuclease n=1 Tax=Cohnella sp. TaxID=1883426 RepID=UPI00356582B1